MSAGERLPEHLRGPLDGVLRALYAQDYPNDDLSDEHWAWAKDWAGRTPENSTVVAYERTLALTLAELAHLPAETLIEMFGLRDVLAAELAILDERVTVAEQAEEAAGQTAWDVLSEAEKDRRIREAGR